MSICLPLPLCVCVSVFRSVCLRYPTIGVHGDDLVVVVLVVLVLAHTPPLGEGPDLGDGRRALKLQSHTQGEYKGQRFVSVGA